jgi:hypothetical protein
VSTHVPEQRPVRRLDSTATETGDRRYAMATRSPSPCSAAPTANVMRGTETAPRRRSRPSESGVATPDRIGGDKGLVPRALEVAGCRAHRAGPLAVYLRRHGFGADVPDLSNFRRPAPGLRTPLSHFRAHPGGLAPRAWAAQVCRLSFRGASRPGKPRRDRKTSSSTG